MCFSAAFSRYASCLGYLQKLKPNLLLDIHLYDHVEALYEQVRHKALIQYTNPFISVDLNTMASAFKTSVAGLEKELAALIMENQIQVCVVQMICLKRNSIMLPLTVQCIPPSQLQGSPMRNLSVVMSQVCVRKWVRLLTVTSELE